MADKEFVDGLFVKQPREGAPDFVKGAISIKRADLGNWLRGKVTEDGWINIDILVAQSGKWYCAVNNFKPEPKAAPAPVAAVANNGPEDDIPF